MSIFNDLTKIDVQSHIEKKNGLSYLSWAWAWDTFKKRCPDARYEVWRDEQGRPYTYDPALGYMVYVTVYAEGESHMMWLPVMDNQNKAMKAEKYTYMTRSGEKEVQAATMFDINTAIMRCLVKCIGMFGLGLYIYAGEDLPMVAPSDLIDSKKVKALGMLCERLGIKVADVCKLYNLSSAESLTEAQYAYIVQHEAEIKKGCEDLSTK